MTTNEQTPVKGRQRSLAERALERSMFALRWVLAPIYLGLAVSLVVVSLTFARKAWNLAEHALAVSSDEAIIGILSLIDLSLVGGLIVMVMFSGYETFISRLSVDEHAERPDWMGAIGFGGLKLKLMTSIVAISAIHVLEDFMHINEVSDRELGWGVGLHLAFIASAVFLALMDRLSGPSH